MAVLVVMLAGSVTTAVPLFVASLGNAAPSAAVVYSHIGFSSAFFVALGVKLVLLGARAGPSRARRLWSSLVAHVGSALSGYTLLTGGLLISSSTWADQHLAASFWLLAVIGVHSRQYGRRAVELLGGALASRGRARGPERPGDSRPPAGREATPVSAEPPSLGETREPIPPSAEGVPRSPSAADVAPALGARPLGAGARRRLVVVGTGLAGLAVVEEALRRRSAGSWRITMLGEEPGRTYNRILLSKLLAKSCDRHELEPRPASWFAANEIDVRAGLPVASIDLQRGAVVDCRGGRHGYDALVLATGSRPIVPPIPGVEAGHVFSFRTRTDVDRIAAAAAAPASAVVVGGGLLGLEAAAGLMACEMKVTVIEASDRLMPQQLDGGAAAMLERALARTGVGVLVGRSVRSVEARSVQLDDGQELAADLVVIAAGIRPEVSLAREAGIATRRGIVVDDEMATSAPGVWAVGECAEHRGSVYGLWAPLLDQARVAGASVSGSPEAFARAVVSTTLKVAGVSVFASGSQAAGPGQREVAWSDDERGTYAKLVLVGDRPVGALAIGDEALGREFARVLSTGEPPAELLAALTPSRSASLPLEPPPSVAHSDSGAPSDLERSENMWAETELVCLCRQVTRGEIVRAICFGGLSTRGDVARATGASAGCGSCAPQVEALIALAS